MDVGFSIFLNSQSIIDSVFYLFILLTSIGSVVIILETRNKALRIIFGLILSFIVAGTLFLWWQSAQQTIANEKEKAGLYKLDITRSVMTGYDSTLYQGLTIRLSEDHTFSISRDVAFLPATKGTWRQTGRQADTYNEFSFRDADVVGHDVVQFGVGDKDLTIESPPAKYYQEMLQVKLLTFIKRSEQGINH